MKKCPQCNHLNPDGAQFCSGCGAELERQCNACGKHVPGDARFCPYCGAVVLSAPPVPWVERRFTPEVRLALHAVTRGLGITFLVMAFITAFLTPPPRIFDETVLLIIGASLMFASEIFKGRKPKPPDDDDGYRRLADPDEPPPDGIKLDPVDAVPLEQIEDLIARRPPPPGSTQGPFLN
ncbi:MAG: hypothetical protein Kow0077_14340 [Anaerolineae bacterium]